MKGLLYKDLCLLLKQMKSILFMVTIFCLCASVLDSFTLFFVMYISTLTPISLLSFDERSKWDTLAAMLPYSTRGLVLSKYICGWLILLYSTLLYGVGLFVGNLRNGSGGDILLQLVFLVSASLILQGLYYPILFRFGVEKGRFAMILIAAVAGGVGFGLLPVLLTLEVSGPILAIGSILVGVLLCFGSVLVSEKQYIKGRGR